MSELAVVNIINKVALAVKDMHGLGIMHRDLFQNVMFHFKEIKPNEADLDKPNKFYSDARKEYIRKALQNLEDPTTFEIKIIDYGISRLMNEGETDKDAKAT